MILLDTCTILWLALDQSQLSKIAKDLIDSGSQKLFLSSVSALEIGRLYQHKKLQLPLTPDEWLEKNMELLNILEIPIHNKEAILSTKLPYHHNDPADRIIIATALQYNLNILTPDKYIKNYTEINTIW